MWRYRDCQPAGCEQASGQPDVAICGGERLPDEAKFHRAVGRRDYDAANRTLVSGVVERRKRRRCLRLWRHRDLKQLRPQLSCHQQLIVFGIIRNAVQHVDRRLTIGRTE